jgi:hypothetical protein
MDFPCQIIISHRSRREGPVSDSCLVQTRSADPPEWNHCRPFEGSRIYPRPRRRLLLLSAHSVSMARCRPSCFLNSLTHGNRKRLVTSDNQHHLNFSRQPSCGDAHYTRRSYPALLCCVHPGSCGTTTALGEKPYTAGRAWFPRHTQSVYLASKRSTTANGLLIPVVLLFGTSALNVLAARAKVLPSRHFVVFDTESPLLDPVVTTCQIPFRSPSSRAS